MTTVQAHRPHREERKAPGSTWRTVGVCVYAVLALAGLIAESLLALGVHVGDGMRCENPTLTCDHTVAYTMTAFLLVTALGGLGTAVAGLVLHRRPIGLWLAGLGFAAQYVCFFTVVAIVFRVFA